MLDMVVMEPSDTMVEAHVLLVAEGCRPQDLEQDLPAGVQVQSGRVLLQIVQKRPLHELKHQVPAAAAPPHVEQVHQVVVTQLLEGGRDGGTI